MLHTFIAQPTTVFLSAPLRSLPASLPGYAPPKIAVDDTVLDVAVRENHDSGRGSSSGKDVVVGLVALVARIKVVGMGEEASSAVEFAAIKEDKSALASGCTARFLTRRELSW